METITEIMDDVDDMPEWMQKAFDEGRLYHRCKEMWNSLTVELARLKPICQRIIDEVEAGENYGLDAWDLVVRTELIDMLQDALQK